MGVVGMVERAAFAGFGRRKGFERGGGLLPARDDRKPLMLDAHARLRADVGPDLARAPRPPPRRAGRVARDRHEPAHAHRRAVGAGLALDDDDASPGARGRERMRKSDDAGADHGEIVAFRHSGPQLW